MSNANTKVVNYIDNEANNIDTEANSIDPDTNNIDDEENGKVDNLEPFYRLTKSNLSDFETILVLVKSSVGIGLVGMPMAFNCVGWFSALIGIYVLTVVVIFAIHITLDGIHKACTLKQLPLMSYSDALSCGFEVGPPAFKKFSNFVMYTADLLMIIYHFAICICYISLIGKNIKIMCGVTVNELMNETIYILMLTPIFVMVFTIKTLRKLMPLIWIGNILVTVASILLLKYSFDEIEWLDTMSMTGKLKLYPIFIGVIVYALNSFGIVIGLEEHMANPKKYLGLRGILTRTFLLVGTFYAVIGFCCYIRFADDTNGNILENLPPYGIVPLMSKIIFLLASFCSFPLQGYIIPDIVCKRYILKHIEDENKAGVEYIIRTCVVLVAVSLAICFSGRMVFIAIMASFCLSLLAAIFPGLLDICLRHKDGWGKCKIYLVQDIIMITFGVLGIALGTIPCILFSMNLYEIDETMNL